jgi:hypothetical protein
MTAGPGRWGRPRTWDTANQSRRALKLCSTSRTRSSLVNAGPAIYATLIPCADKTPPAPAATPPATQCRGARCAATGCPHHHRSHAPRTRPTRQCEPMITQPSGTSGQVGAGRPNLARPQAQQPRGHPRKGSRAAGRLQVEVPACRVSLWRGSLAARVPAENGRPARPTAPAWASLGWR